jgi:hypothetical protein
LIHEAYGAMQHNRRRTALTMLGMAWGIATVVLLLAYGNGFGRACANIFANQLWYWIVSHLESADLGMIHYQDGILVSSAPAEAATGD